MNQKVSNVVDHATRNVHKIAMAYYRVESAKACGSLSSVIGRCLDETTRARIEWKFGIYILLWMAKEGIPFAKYPAPLQLEEVDIGHATTHQTQLKLIVHGLLNTPRL